MKLMGKRSVSSILKVTLDGLIIITSFVYALAIFFLIVAALSGNTASHEEFINLGIPYTLEGADHAPEIQPLEAKLAGMALGFEISRDLSLNLTKWWFLILIMLFMSLIVAIFIYIIVQLRQFLASLIEGNPFVLDNAKRIRIIGIVIIAGELCINSLMIGTAMIINANVNIVEAKIAWGSLFANFDLSTLFLGIVVLIIAEIFRLGVQLREDQELTI